MPLCKALEKHSIQYVMIGGYAVNHHGYVRATADLDIWYNPTYSKLIVVIKELGFEVDQLEQNTFDPRKSFIRLPLEKFYVELLPSIDIRIPFGEVYANAVEDNFNGLKIKVISYDP